MLPKRFSLNTATTINKSGNCIEFLMIKLNIACKYFVMNKEENDNSVVLLFVYTTYHWS